MTVFDLQAKLGLDKSGFDKGVREAKGSGQDLGDSLSSSFNKIKNVAKTVLTAAIFKEIIDGARELVDEVARVGDTIDKQSQVLGMSRKSYQEWDYILSQNGASIDALGASMRTLNTVFMSAKEGGEEANNAFAQLGLSVHELEQMDPEQQFETLVRALQKLPAGAQKSALAVKLFGRGGTQLLPLLNQSSDSIDKLRERAEELGLIMGDDAVDSAVEYTDSLDTLKRTFNAFKYSIGSQILPVLTNGMQKITNYAGKLRKAYEEKGFSGVWETIVEDFKKIKWPSWEQVKEAVTKAWNGIVEGVKGLAKIIFGENVDGEIDWPTWEEIGEAIGNAWNGIVEGVKGLAKLIFGENVDGSIKWPTWDEIKIAVQTAWKGIVDGVSGLATGIGKAVFGTNVDGTIKWPTWDDVKVAIQKAWKGIVNGVNSLGTEIGKAIFGTNVDGTIKWPTWDDIKSAIQTAWKGIVAGVSALGTEIGKAVFGENVDGDIDWPTWDGIKNAVQKAWRDIVNGVKGLGTEIGKAIFGENVDDSIKWPTWDDIGTAIQTAWGTITEQIGKLPELIFGKGASVSSDITNTINAIKTDIENFVNFLKDPLNYEPNGTGKITGYDLELPERLRNNANDNPNGNAKGNWAVPYDNFPALLHRNEMVLTASQARRYREGGESNLDVDQLAGAIVGAIREGMDGAQVNSYMDGKSVTNRTNNVTGNRLMARRFAPV